MELSGVYVVQFAHLHVLTSSVPSCDVLHDFRFPDCLRSFLCCMHLCFIYVICILRRLVSNTLMLVSLSRNLTSHTIGSGTDNPSGTRAFTLDIQWDSRWLVICVVFCRSLFDSLSFSFWSLYYLPFIGVWLLITRWYFQTFQCKQCKHAIKLRIWSKYIRTTTMQTIAQTVHKTYNGQGTMWND
jgi:hypothetical protein